MVQIRPWRSGDEGRESNSQPIFSNLSSTVLGISNSRWLLTWRQRPSGSNLHRWEWSISKFWNRCHRELHYRWPCIHRRSRRVNGLIKWRCKVRRRCRTL
jgi:hypothetical protein